LTLIEVRGSDAVDADASHGSALDDHIGSQSLRAGNDFQAAAPFDEVLRSEQYGLRREPFATRLFAAARTQVAPDVVVGRESRIVLARVCEECKFTWFQHQVGKSRITDFSLLC
jgi:hypothetical protein